MDTEKRAADAPRGDGQSFADPIMQYFAYAHLPPALQEFSKPFCELASWIAGNLPQCAERTVALRKLLEAKDAGVRASLYKKA